MEQQNHSVYDSEIDLHVVHKKLTFDTDSVRDIFFSHKQHSCERFVVVSERKVMEWKKKM